MDRVRLRLRTIIGILEDDTDLRQAKQGIEIAAQSCKTAEQELHKAESAVNDQRLKIEQMESSLYGGAVHIPKELQDMQNDVASLKRHLVTLEDLQIEAMQSLETAETQSQAAQAHLQEISIRLLQQNQSLAGEREQLQKELEKMEAERQAIIAGVPSGLLSRYESLRQNHRGIAVAGISDSSCTACGSSLTPALAQSARLASELVFCPTCGRILYGG